MYLEGSRLIESSRKAVWEAINNEAVLAHCIPGCQQLDRVSDTEFEGRLHQSIGLITATFEGKMTFENIQPLEGCRIIATGRSASAGSASCTAAVRLLEVSPNQTELIYGADASSDGPLSELDEQVLMSTSERIIAEFLDNLAGEIQIDITEEPAAITEPGEDLFDIPLEAVSLAPATEQSGANRVDEFGLAPVSAALDRDLRDARPSDGIASQGHVAIRPEALPQPPPGMPQPKAAEVRTGSAIDIDDASLLPEGVAPPLAAEEIPAQGDVASRQKAPEGNYWLWSLLGGILLIGAAYLIGG